MLIKALFSFERLGRLGFHKFRIVFIGDAKGSDCPPDINNAAAATQEQFQQLVVMPALEMRACGPVWTGTFEKI